VSTQATRRAILGTLAAAPLAAAPGASIALAGEAAPQPLSDLARACVAQAERLAWLDQPENTAGMSEEAHDAEMDRWGAVIQRAIDEPSAGAPDLAAKARLMLDDLDRFHPEEAGACTFLVGNVVGLDPIPD